MQKQTVFGSERFIVSWGRWVTGHPWMTLFGTLLIVVGSAIGAKNLTFTTDYRVYFGPDNPQLLAFDEMQNVYVKSDNVLMMVTPREGDVFQPRILEAVREMTVAGWTLPYALRVDSITNYQHTEAEADDLLVQALFPPGEEATPERIAKMRDVTLAEPLLVHRLISDTGHVTAINITFQFPQADQLTQKELPQTVTAVRELRDRILAEYPEIERIDMTGANMISNAFTEASLADAKTLIPAMYLVIIIVMTLMFRSAWATVATMAIVMLSSITAMGLAGWVGIGLTPPSASAPTIITTLAVADCVHLYLTAFMLIRSGRNKVEAIVESVRINFMAVLLTSVTTSIGFSTVNLTDSPPLKDLANITIMGVMAAWLFSVTTLPALMTLLPMKVPKTDAERSSRLTRSMDRLADFVIKRRHPVFFAMLGIGVVFTVLAFQNEGNDNFVEYFDERISFRTETDHIVEQLTGLYGLSYSLNCGESNCISDPAFLAKLEAYRKWWETQPKVLWVGTISEIYKRLNKNMHGDDPAWYRVPEERDLAAQYMLLYEMSLPFGLDLNDQINQDKSSTRFTIVTETMKSKEVRDIEEAGRQWLRDNAPELETHGTSPPVMFSHISERNLRSNFISLPLSLVGISLLMIPLLRTFRLGLAFLLPNLVPLGLGFGVWALVSGEVNFTMAIVLNMTVGIIVDDAIHFMTKYLRARREQGLEPEAAIRYTFHNVAGALVVTTIVLCAGFLILAQSAFLPNSGMAQLATITIAGALAVDLLLLPPFLLLLDRSETERPSKEMTDEALATK